MGTIWSRIRRWSGRFIKFALVVVVTVGLIYWMRFAPVSVIEFRLERGPIAAEVLGTGTLEARVSATISPKISGRIDEVIVDQGDQVSDGDLLVRLDDEELQQQVAIAQANVDANVAAIVRLKTDKNRGAAVFEQAQKSHRRTVVLAERNATTEEDVDKATETLALAVVGVSRAEAAIMEGQKELVTAEKTLEYHRARLQDTKIKAPFAGMIVKRVREPGDVVVPGSPILTLISTDELWVSAWVDETEMANIQPELTARVLFRSQPSDSYPGKVVRLGREADRETREFIVDVGVLELPKNWAVGQRAEVYIEMARKQDVILIPSQFLVRRNDGVGTYVNDNGHAMWKLVELGLRGSEMVEVTQGLEAGETVVIPSDLKKSLSDGRKIVTP